jgi:hypothetical protein
MKSSNIGTASLMLRQQKPSIDLFRAVIEQLQPKQRRAAKIDLRSPKHADFAVPNRGERNRHFWTILQNRGEFDVSSRNSQFGNGRVAACQTIILKCVVRTIRCGECTIEPPQTAQQDCSTSISRKLQAQTDIARQVRMRLLRPAQLFVVLRQHRAPFP